MKADEIKMEVATEPTEIQMRRFKKTRRGKKRRFNTQDDANNPSHSPPTIESDCCNCVTQDKYFHNESFAEPLPEGATSGPLTLCNSGNFKRPMLRPLDVPKAPSNSTQFIMDDHENCKLYVSFESPRRRRSSGSEGSDSPCKGYWDIDYAYESPPDDIDNEAYFDKDFEIIYRTAKEDELMELNRAELIKLIIDFEDQVSSYEKLMNGTLPSVDHLQEEMLKMQEDNSLLLKMNKCLRDGSSLNSSISTDSDLGESDLCLSMEENDGQIEEAGHCQLGEDRDR